jgi:hypothetical protein
VDAAGARYDELRAGQAPALANVYETSGSELRWIWNGSNMRFESLDLQ